MIVNRHNRKQRNKNSVFVITERIVGKFGVSHGAHGVHRGSFVILRFVSIILSELTVVRQVTKDFLSIALNLRESAFIRA